VAANAASPEFSPGTRILAKDSCARTLLWSERGSRSYLLSGQAAPGILPSAALVRPGTSQVKVHEDQPGPG